MTQIQAAVSQGVIDQNEADKVLAANAARDKVVQVDDFSPQELGAKTALPGPTAAASN